MIPALTRKEKAHRGHGGFVTTTTGGAVVCPDSTTSERRGQLESEMAAADATGDTAAWVDAFIGWLDCLRVGQ